MPKYEDNLIIVELDKDEIIVVGTNMNGQHFGGAARQAWESFGLAWFCAEGLCGQTYALPTLDKQMRQRNDKQITTSVKKLFDCAKENPDNSFLLTKVGCGIASFDEDYIKDKFRNCPKNIILPKDWK